MAKKKKKADNSHLQEEENSIIEDEQEVVNKRELLIFQLGSEQFAFDISNDISHIEEIKMLPKITPVPRAKLFVMGITTLRGTLFPIIDLALFLKMSPVVDTLDARVIIFNFIDEMIGFYVDRVTGVRMIKETQISTLNQAMPLDNQYYNGVFSHDTQFVAYLNLQAIVTSSMLERLHKNGDEM